jgi:hypothetical protein
MIAPSFLVDAAELQELVGAHQLRVAVAICASAGVVLLIVVGLLLWLRSTVALSNKLPSLHHSRPCALFNVDEQLPRSLEQAAELIGMNREGLLTSGIVDFDTLLALPPSTVSSSMYTPAENRRALYLTELGKRVRL